MADELTLAEQRVLALLREYSHRPDVTFELVKRGGRIVDIKVIVMHQRDIRAWGESGPLSATAAAPGRRTS